MSLFAEKTDTPILFLYLEGNADLMPKGRAIPKPGPLTIHVGPVIMPPAPVDELMPEYRKFATSINPNAYKDADKDTLEESDDQ